MNKYLEKIIHGGTSQLQAVTLQDLGTCLFCSDTNLHVFIPDDCNHYLVREAVRGILRSK